MEEGNLILLIVAGIGFTQVSAAAVLAYANNKAGTKSRTNKEKESVYAGLVDRLEKRLEEECERITVLEEKCKKYERLLGQHESISIEVGE